MRWIRHPKLLIVFAAVCLCVGAAADQLRPAGLAASQRPSIVMGVKGRQTPVPAAPAPDCSVLPCLALTFDDGPETEATTYILDVLAAQQVHATFFVVGNRIQGHEALLRRMHAEGHEIGNHTWAHPDLTRLTPAEIDVQLELVQTAVAAAGVPVPTTLRPPYGMVNDTLRNHSKLAIVRWNVDPEDWRSTDPSKISAAIVSQARPGGVILLHDRRISTALALGQAVQTLKPRYQFVTVSQLLGLGPGDQGQFFGW